MDVNQESLKLHEELRGKIEVVARRHIETRDDLSLLYTPGVAEPCREIAKDYEKSFTLTRRGNLVAVITDGSAVLGLGDIGPAAGMPVMEGKCALFKEFGGVDAFPLCVDTKDVDKLVETIALISKSFGGINLEDIAAPRCFEVGRRLKEVCDIPVFHDDQHGTAIVVAAALLNAMRVTGKQMGQMKIVINGAGAAGIAIVLFSVDNAMMFYVGVFLFGIGFAALNIVPPMACRQAFGQKDYANIFSMVATGLNVFSGFSALIYAQIFDITGSFAGCFYLIIGFYVVTLICSLVIVPMGRRSWAKK